MNNISEYINESYIPCKMHKNMNNEIKSPNEMFNIDRSPSRPELQYISQFSPLQGQ